jgi:hypothetical protein
MVTAALLSTAFALRIDATVDEAQAIMPFGPMDLPEQVARKFATLIGLEKGSKSYQRIAAEAESQQREFHVNVRTRNTSVVAELGRRCYADSHLHFPNEHFEQSKLHWTISEPIWLLGNDEVALVANISSTTRPDPLGLHLCIRAEFPHTRCDAKLTAVRASD